MMYAEVKKYRGTQPWRWRFIARNGKVTANNEGHPSKTNAMRALKAVVRGVRSAWPGTPTYFTAEEKAGVTIVRWT